MAGVGYGPEAVGHLAAAFSLVVMATVVLYPALGYAVLRHRDEFVLTSGLLRRMGLALLGGTLLGALLLVIDSSTFGWSSRVLATPDWSLWVIVLAALTVAEQYALGLCSVAGILDRYSVAMLGSRLALIAGAGLFTALRVDLAWLLALSAATSIVFLLQAARSLGRLPRGPSPKGLLRDGISAAPNSWAWFLMAQGSILAVQAFMGASAAGVFTIAYLLLNLPILIIQGVSMTWTSLASRHGPGREWGRTRHLVPRLVAVHVALVLLLATLGGVLWGALFGDGLAPAFGLLRTMWIGAAGFAMAYLLMPQLMARGWFKWLSAVSMALAVLYVAAVASAARLGSLSLLAWCTAALGVGLALANGWAAWHWNRAHALSRATSPGQP